MNFKESRVKKSNYEKKTLKEFQYLANNAQLHFLKKLVTFSKETRYCYVSCT